MGALARRCSCQPIPLTHSSPFGSAPVSQ